MIASAIETGAFTPPTVPVTPIARPARISSNTCAVFPRPASTTIGRPVPPQSSASTRLRFAPAGLRMIRY
jgi:hypothetical protein